LPRTRASYYRRTKTESKDIIEKDIVTHQSFLLKLDDKEYFE